MRGHYKSTILCRIELNPTYHSYRFFGKKQKKDISSLMTKEILHTFNSTFPNGTFLDASFGEGGHSINLIKSSLDNHIIGLDCDHTISKRTPSYLQHKYKESNRFQFIHSKWSNMFGNIMRKLPEISETTPFFDGILLDTGPATLHEKIRHRALIFDTRTSNLDMRYYTTTAKHDSLAVRDLINHQHMTIELLSNIISIFGDQNIDLSTKIANGILCSETPVTNMEHIVTVIGNVLKNEKKEYLNPLFLFNRKKASLIRNEHPIKQTLNALIRFINNSFIELSLALRQTELLLKPNGILIIICYEQLESRIIAEFLKSRSLLNLDADNKIEKAIVYVDKERDNMNTTFGICDHTIYLKQRNERLGDHDWQGIGAARFNDFNAVPFIQPHVAEKSSHPKGKYGRMLVLERTNMNSNEDWNVFMDNEDKLTTQALTYNNLKDVIEARNDVTRRLLQFPTHNCFLP
eukprot:294565_1